jgi:EAL domain-containing protein (putative c-di-GMP-specific phosphodiesterase class I)
VVTDDPHGARNLAEKIQGAARERGLESLRVEEVLLSLKGRNLTPEQNVLALRYVVTRFADGAIKSVASADLAATFDSMMDETLARAQNFNTTVADGAFDLAFEPIVDLKTGTPSHYEALTRFKPGQSPANTIKFAEDLGLTDAFDMAVALKAFSVLENDMSITASVAINISGRSFANSEAFGVLAGLLAKKRALAKRVLIEVTESAEMPDLVAAETAIQSLRRMGYCVGIDDFGSGAASLQYLHGFTVDFVKMDGAVIQRDGQISARRRAAEKRAFHMRGTKNRDRGGMDRQPRKIEALPRYWVHLWTGPPFRRGAHGTSQGCRANVPGAPRRRKGQLGLTEQARSTLRASFGYIPRIVT